MIPNLKSVIKCPRIISFKPGNHYLISSFSRKAVWENREKIESSATLEILALGAEAL